MGGTIKSMKLYSQVERIENELRALGFADNMAFTGILSSLLLDETFVRGAGGAET